MQTTIRLTGRESAVLRLIAYRKLDMHCAAAAVMRAVELQLLEEA